VNSYYALGRSGDPTWWIGALHDGRFIWAMPRGRFELVISGQAGKHCESCTCSDQSADGSVIEDDQGTRYTRTGFMGVLLSATSEDRTMTEEQRT
jgi:hypothetical protein